MVVDDLAIAATFDSSVQSFLIRVFAKFRNKNISVMVTVQSDSSSLLDILRNSTFVIIMQGFGSQRTIRKVLRDFVAMINVPKVIRKIYPLLEEVRTGAYIFIILSDLSNRNRQFTITNDIFMPLVGFTRSFCKHYHLHKGDKGRLKKKKKDNVPIK